MTLGTSSLGSSALGSATHTLATIALPALVSRGVIVVSIDGVPLEGSLDPLASLSEASGQGMIIEPVLISLFSDRRRRDWQHPRQSGERGWWADKYLATGQASGSGIWAVIDRGRAQEIRQEAIDALRWMLRKQLVASIDVRVSATAPGAVALVIDLAFSDGHLLAIEFPNLNQLTELR